MYNFAAEKGVHFIPNIGAQLVGDAETSSGLICKSDDFNGHTIDSIYGGHSAIL